MVATPHLLMKNSIFLHAVLYHLDTAYPNSPRHEVEDCKNHHRLLRRACGLWAQKGPFGPHWEIILGPHFSIEIPDSDLDGCGHLHWTWFCLRFPKYIILGVLNEIVVRNHPILGVPDVDHDGGGHLHWTWLCIRFPKKYWGVKWQIVVRNLPILGGHPPSSWGDHDVWGHLHWTGFCPRFPKIYNTWGVKWKIVVRILPIHGGHPPYSWGS